MKLSLVFLFSVVLLAGCMSTAGNQPTIVLTAPQQAMVDELLQNMVAIPAGEFLMGDVNDTGDEDELPVRSVKVSAFAISRYEVTFEQYDMFAQATGRPLPADQGWGRASRPVINVNWNDAVAFAEWLSAATGMRFRLPSEAEWEYVARAGGQAEFGYGDDVTQLCDHGNTADRSAKTGWRNMKCADGFANTAPVGSFQANAFGVYDMQGNVWEWVADCWFKHYKKAPNTSAPRLREGCTSRGQRGGSWFYGTDEARSSFRSYGNVQDTSVTQGFRVARDW